MAFNAQSLLLKLPQEIKDHIYVLVCGGNLLHFNFASPMSQRYIDTRLSHVKCLSQATEEDAQASFDTSKSPWFDEANSYRHHGCCAFKLFDDISGRVPEEFRLDLRFLRTCRQIHDEAKNYCYTANTISFNGLGNLRKFLETVSWVSYIRSIRLGITIVNDGDDGDGRITRETMQDLCSKLTRLRSIHIQLEQFHTIRSRRYNQGAENTSHLTGQLLCFAGTRLKTATVIISDARFAEFDYPEIETMQPPWDDYWSRYLPRWTMTEKQEYSRFLRNALLQHKDT